MRQIHVFQRNVCTVHFTVIYLTQCHLHTVRLSGASRWRSPTPSKWRFLCSTVIILLLHVHNCTVYVISLQCNFILTIVVTKQLMSLNSLFVELVQRDELPDRSKMIIIHMSVELLSCYHQQYHIRFIGTSKVPNFYLLNIPFSSLNLAVATMGALQLYTRDEEGPDSIRTC